MAEVETYKALALKPGYWAADGGWLPIGPADIDRVHQTFNQLQAEGFAFTTPWGHKLDALPEAAADDPYAYDEARARWNAGYIVGLERQGDELWAINTVPPGYRYSEAHKALVNDRDGTIVRETSPGIGTWTDGLGRTHDKVLFHLALVTHPVQHGQTGFLPATAAADPARAAGRRFLSTAGRVTGLRFLSAGKPPMPDDDKKKKGPPPAKNDGDADDKPKGAPKGSPADDEGLAGLLGGGADAPDDPGPLDAAALGDSTGAPPPGELPVPPEAPALDAAAAPAADPNPAGLGGVLTPSMLEQYKAVLAQLGAPMLPDTSASNFLERLLTSLHTLANTGASLQPQAGGAGAAPGLDLGTQGAAPDPNAQGMGAGGMGSPMFMSTRTKKPLTLDPAARALAGRQAETELAAIEAEWDRIATAGDATVKARCQQEKARLRTFHLSLNEETGEVRADSARKALADAKFWATRGGLFKLTKKLSTAAVETGNPAQAAPKPKPAAAPAAPSADLAGEVGRLLNVPAERVRVPAAIPAT